ncbi:Toprim-like [Methylomagnum ishizawai]|uniref:Toprim-like n=1 Tax=Methylomagnum ishizawai TaxID=1760988 RepID=A0A1Y6D1Z4_9GAMM|nr:toprim domain-containing protein [Methylomagnum ishizawai]SMF94414.1 Toprim-like [Methylomagnum ishizawai]
MRTQHTRIDLAPEIAARLIREFQFKEEGTHLRKGVCPACGKKELWTWAEKPFHIQCARLSKCGWESGAKALFPELFTEFNKRYPATPADPLATARAYLQYHRGFDPAPLEGMYTQGTYWNPHGDKGTATVRFALAEGVYWEKLIEPVRIQAPGEEPETRGENFGGKYKGLAWAPPGLELAQGDKLYMAEGIFDALALRAAGKKAIALMSCANFPEHFIADHRDLGITWILALDPDPAGRKSTLKHIARLKDMGQKTGCVLPSEGEAKVDWNDLYQQGRLEEPSAWKNFRYYGSLLTAETREDKARVIFGHKGLNSFIFEFGNRTHAFKLDADKYTKALAEAVDIPTMAGDEEAQKRYALEASGNIKEIATVAMEFRYVEVAEETEESLNFLRIRYPNGTPAQNVGLPGNVFASASDFKKRLLSVAPGAQWTGTSDHLDTLYRGWFLRRHTTIKSIDYIGYDRASGAYLYHDFAILAGKLIPKNPDDYFELGKAGGMKTTSTIGIKLSTEIDLSWFADYRAAFGQRGLVGLAWWLGSLFAEQIRERHESYPFFEMCGEPGSGKSRMLEFLWKLCGRNNHEGFNPNLSTMIGRSREFAQVSNLPVVLIEANHYDDRPHVRVMNWEELLTLFDGQIGRVSGVKNQGTTTRNPPFRGALAMSQNTPINASEAFLSRLVQVKFDKRDHTPAGRDASERLNLMAVERLSGFLRAAVCREKEILDLFNSKVRAHEKWILGAGGVSMVRIATNHAYLMALVECLALLLPLSEEDVTRVHGVLYQLAIDRQNALSSDHEVIERFWNVFELLDRSAGKDAMGQPVELEGWQNHSRNPDTEIAVNIESFQAACSKAGIEAFREKDLRALFPDSKRYKFMENKHVNSRITGTTLRCWVFSKSGGK